MASRGNGQSSKVPTKSQTSVLPPAAPQIPADLNLKVNLDLKKKRPVESLEEGEVGLHQGSKQQKTTQKHQDKRAPSVESREETERVEVRMPPRTWSPQLEVDEASIPYNLQSKSIIGAERGTLLKPWSSLFSFPGTWRLTGDFHSLNSSYP